MSATNRETVRDALYTLLNAALVGAGLPCQAMYGYLVNDFGGQSPVAVLSSRGSERDYDVLSDTYESVSFWLDFWAFVLYTDPESSWSEADAEDRLDLIEKTVADTLAANSTTNANWEDLQMERSIVDTVVSDGGIPYRRELIPIRVVVYGE